MKVPQSVRVLYEDLQPMYARLKTEVDAIILGQKESRWHFESRVKTEESFALKLETGRVRDPRAPEDFFACTVVVENHARIPVAEKFICDRFKLETRRPRDAQQTHLAPSSFEFDDLRLYVKWRDDPAQRPTGFDGVVFEVQIKTFLQHAWGIATHDFVYKSDDADWSSSRIAYQVKAMLENAELSIGAAQKLTSSAMLNRSDQHSTDLRATIGEIRKRWESAQLPTDLLRLATTISDAAKWLSIPLNQIWVAVDAASAVGEGAKTLNLSPYAAIIASLIRQRGARAFENLADPRCPGAIFVPLEIDLPAIAAAGMAKVIRPPAKP